MKNILKKISSGILVALFVFTGVIGLLSPKDVFAADCDVVSVTAHAVDYADTDYSLTHLNNLPSWDINTYSDFADASGLNFLKKIRYVIKTENCKNVSLLSKLISNRDAGLSEKVVAEKEIVPNADEIAVLDVKPGEDFCGFVVPTQNYGTQNPFGDDCSFQFKVFGPSGSNLFSQDDFSDYECTGKAGVIANLLPPDIQCDWDQQQFAVLGSYPTLGTSIETGQCEVITVELIKGPHYADGTLLKKQDGSNAEWPATEKISTEIKLVFSNECIGKSIDFKIFEFDATVLDTDPEVFTGNLNNILQSQVELKLAVGNILGDACENDSEYYIKFDDTDLVQPKESPVLFSMKCNSGQAANTPWSIDSSTGGGVDPSNKDLYISRPILGTNADKLKPSFFTTVKNIYPATYGFVVTKKSDANTEVANTYKNDPKTKTASSSENGESVSPIEILLSPPADIYKIVSHATDDHGNIEYSSEATIYDATTGTVTGSETFDAAEAEEQEYLANQGIMPIKVDSTKYQLLEPLGDYKEVKTDSIGVYVNILVEILIGIIGVMAVLVLVFAGVQYMTTQAIAEKGEAKGLISGALAALFIVLVMYLILRTINPDLLDLDPDITSVKIKEGVSNLSDVDYQSLTGKTKPLPADVKASADKISAEKAIDACLSEALIAKESGYDAGAIGHDENVANTKSRSAFAASKKTYKGITFSTTPAKNDATDSTPDWRFSNGIGLMQITLFPPSYFTADYVTKASSDDAWSKRTIPNTRNDIDGTAYTMEMLLDKDTNLKAGLTLLKTNYVDCGTVVGALTKYNSGSCNGTTVPNYVKDIVAGYNGCCENSTCKMKLE